MERREPTVADLTVRPGLCATCAHLLLASSGRSVFVRCGLAQSDPRFPRYPALPVRTCLGFTPGGEKESALRSGPEGRED